MARNGGAEAGPAHVARPARRRIVGILSIGATPLQHLTINRHAAVVPARTYGPDARAATGVAGYAQSISRPSPSRRSLARRLAGRAAETERRASAAETRHEKESPARPEPAGQSVSSSSGGRGGGPLDGPATLGQRWLLLEQRPRMRAVAVRDKEALPAGPESSG